ncbi:MAG: hypothetical protein FWD72_03640 [Eggerthellaceae bacterium]|nr:hypothetical protein [Eggerthellaceae bacterium]
MKESLDALSWDRVLTIGKMLQIENSPEERYNLARELVAISQANTSLMGKLGVSTGSLSGVLMPSGIEMLVAETFENYASAYLPESDNERAALPQASVDSSRPEETATTSAITPRPLSEVPMVAPQPPSGVAAVDPQTVPDLPMAASLPLSEAPSAPQPFGGVAAVDTLPSPDPAAITPRPLSEVPMVTAQPQGGVLAAPSRPSGETPVIAVQAASEAPVNEPLPQREAPAADDWPICAVSTFKANPAPTAAPSPQAPAKVQAPAVSPVVEVPVILREQAVAAPAKWQEPVAEAPATRQEPVAETSAHWQEPAAEAPATRKEQAVATPAHWQGQAAEAPANGQQHEASLPSNGVPDTVSLQESGSGLDRYLSSLDAVNFTPKATPQGSPYFNLVSTPPTEPVQTGNAAFSRPVSSASRQEAPWVSLKESLSSLPSTMDDTNHAPGLSGASQSIIIPVTGPSETMPDIVDDMSSFFLAPGRDDSFIPRGDVAHPVSGSSKTVIDHQGQTQAPTVPQGGMQAPAFGNTSMNGKAFVISEDLEKRANTARMLGEHKERRAADDAPFNRLPDNRPVRGQDLARLKQIYASKDGSLCLYQDVSGHVVAVDSSQLA